MAKKKTEIPVDPPDAPVVEHFWDPKNVHDLQAMIAEANE